MSAALLATLTRLLARVLGLLARVLVLATLLTTLLAALILLVHATFPFPVALLSNANGFCFVPDIGR
ncbi:MAG: hypothetical protein WCA56_07510 [Xanthobacteraceae bacterium]